MAQARYINSRNRLLVVASGALIAAVFVLLFLFNPRFMRDLDYTLYDQLNQFKPVSTGNPDIVIVDIDERSLNALGQWPWPRYRLAELLDRISDQQPRAVGIDILLPEADRHSPANMLGDLQTNFGIEDLSSGLPEQIKDFDQILQRSLAKGPFVLAEKLVFESDLQELPGCRPATLPFTADMVRSLDGSGIFPPAREVLCPIPPLQQAVQMTGIINALPDSDGVVRRAPIIARAPNGFVPSLALATWLRANDQAILGITRERDYIKGLRLNRLNIPFDQTGNVWLNYRQAPPQYEYLSALSLFENEVDRNHLKNRFVFIGTSAAGLGDISVTPLNPLVPAVELHAVLLDNLLAGDAISRPYYAKGVELLLMLLLSAVAIVCISHFRAAVSVSTLLFTGFVSILASYQILVSGLTYFSPLYTVLCLATLALVLFFLRYYLAERQEFLLTRQLADTQSAAIRSLAALAETRDLETGAHIIRTEKYMKLLAERLRRHPRYRRIINRKAVEQISTMAPLHDIGKVGIPDSILRKPAPLTEDEMAVMRTHPDLGRAILQTGAQKLEDASFLKYATDIAWCHHEKWDGSGYPRGLSGEDIPLAGRMMAIADVYDALISKRVYKSAFSHETAIKIMREKRGGHFDPNLLDIFLDLETDCRKIAEQYPDEMDERADYAGDQISITTEVPRGQ